ncbi:hypothetical protein JQ557_09220 [Bradyrhizobium sp. U87765 SZCCT0131]|uniref:COG4315 family predicted lipoprotein n=1 Tax=unclassified Bradyrhizobium TaxID=2631580 RepID=UPI001BAB6526|nr:MULTISPECIES: hypothetical protein [unclassified Bradyrhizobium]MBR1218165.1 hypothetical protein [Bradyrhizobium sp. U87765 SZCCT0131]MBR1260889.1 hypothetical protein [Bradyrhizobium sp. U87765 SZCCT0134]MBR1303663.1 hypothetical protein [Bradyrhizobium sp. U87765 SZCCT0110]MBR1319269.1 hypothetical protein [Bradyrhizobium sp. U87765 SZCCT0109]MBR1347594.1 hypothetical protein [Bradyrhizobium sp. U87765 SZCCT0048]
MPRPPILAAALLLLATGAALAQTAPATTADTAKGKALVDAKGMTLYVFDKDATSKSNCNGACTQNWPPLAAASDARPSGDWSAIAREDGSRMWAYKGHPLYTWKNDKAPGDTSGDGVNGVWHIARP